MKLLTFHLGRETQRFKGKQPYAVVFGMNGLWVITGVCVDCSDPDAKIPPHSIVITPQSPAYQGSGFTAEKVAISVLDMFAPRTCSSFVQDMQQAGVLDTSKDEQLDQRLTKLLTMYGRKVVRL